MIPVGYKPNLAATMTKPELIQFPVLASPKIDGIRCTMFNGVAYSRTLKPIPNRFVQAWAQTNLRLLNYMDGELIVGKPTDPNVMQATTSGVMRREGEPDFSFHAFDYLRIVGLSFSTRYDDLQRRYIEMFSEKLRVYIVPQAFIRDSDELEDYEASTLAQGYEGVMLRIPNSGYKFGRSTEREGGLVKVKRFADAEAEIIGFVEAMQNTNEATLDAFGRTERSSVKAGLVGKDTLGALVVRSPDGIEFNIGTGFTAEQRRELWATRHFLVGQLVTYKFFPHGVKEAPRHPVFKSFRSKDDL